MNEKFNLVVFFFIAITFLVLPTTAVTNIIYPGDCVFIGEEGLDISEALDGATQIAWWSPELDPSIDVPSDVISIEDAYDFYVAPADFVGQTGNWYQYPIITDPIVAFIVDEPSIDIKIYDGTSHLDVTNGIIPLDHFGNFLIETNLDEIVERNLYDGDGIVDIIVNYQDGSTYTMLYGANNLEHELISLPVSEFEWYWIGEGDDHSTLPSDDGWNTGAIDPSNVRYYNAGGYTIWAECNVNNMMENYPDIGKTITAEKNVELQAPNIDFTATPLTGESPLLVQFFDTSSQAWVDSWQWDFGDGSTSSLQSPNHTYSTPGWYTVTLRASNINGEWLKMVKQDYINVQSSLEIGEIFPSRLGGYAPCSVIFSTNASVNGRGSEESDKFIQEWSWDFGDSDEFGNKFIGTGKKTEHVYQRPGIYYVSVQCKLYDGSVALDSLDDPIVVGPEILPNYYWEYLLSDPTCCYLVKFTNTTKLQSGNPDPLLLWDFGDGAVSTEQNPTHRFKEVGNYSVNLTVSQLGLSKSVIHQIPIIAGYKSPELISEPINPTAAFTYLINPSTLTVDFTDTSKGLGIYLWAWEFGDGTVSGEQNPVHTYTRKGQYLIQLEVVNTVASSKIQGWITVDG